MSLPECTLCTGSHLSSSFNNSVRTAGEWYLGSFPQKLGQSNNVGFELSLVSPLTSHFQPWIVWGLWDEGPAIPVTRQHTLSGFDLFYKSLQLSGYDTFYRTHVRFCQIHTKAWAICSFTNGKQKQSPCIHALCLVILLINTNKCQACYDPVSSVLTFGTEAGSQEAESGPGPGACRQTGRGWAIAGCCTRWKSHSHRNKWSPAQPRTAPMFYRRTGQDKPKSFIQ